MAEIQEDSVIIAAVAPDRSAPAESTRKRRHSESNDLNEIKPENVEYEVVTSGEPPIKKQRHAEFSTEDRIKLINLMKQQFPKKDVHSYKSTVGKVKWNNICGAFDDFSGEDCRQEWEFIQAGIRKFKTATEVVNEAIILVKSPNYIQKKLSSLHPDMPKKPLTPFFSFYSEKSKVTREKTPGVNQTAISQILSQKYKSLSDKKKQKYITRYEEQMKAYEGAKAKFLEQHPELVQSIKSEKVKPPAIPIPFKLFFEKNMKDYPEDAIQTHRSEIETEIRKQWKALSDKKRLKWINLSVQQKDAYDKEIANYILLHPHVKGPSKPLLNKHEKFLLDRQQGKPTRPPMTGYSLFCSKFMKMKSDLSPKERMQMCSVEWKKLTNHQREQYQLITAQAKKDYHHQLENYAKSLPPEEQKLYKSELETLRKPPSSKKKSKSKQNTAVSLYIADYRAKYRKKHPNLDKTDIDKMLTEKYEALDDMKKKFYEERAEELNESSSESEDDSSDDDEEHFSEKENILARNLWIDHNIVSYMQVHKLTRSKATKSLQLAWEEQEKTKKIPWIKQANEIQSRMYKLLEQCPKKPHTSAYGIYTSDMMKSLDMASVSNNNNKMKAVAEKWRNASKVEKKKYEAKKERLWKKYNKDLEKYKKSLSDSDQHLLVKALTHPNLKLKKKNAKKLKQLQETATESDSDESDSDSDEDSSSEEASEEEEGTKKKTAQKEGSDDSDDDDDSDDEEEEPAATSRAKTTPKKDAATESDDSDEESSSDSDSSSEAEGD